MHAAKRLRWLLRDPPRSSLEASLLPPASYVLRPRVEPMDKFLPVNRNPPAHPRLPTSGLENQGQRPGQLPDLPPTGRGFVEPVPGTSGGSTPHALARPRIDLSRLLRRFVILGQGSPRQSPSWKPGSGSDPTRNCARCWGSYERGGDRFSGPLEGCGPSGRSPATANSFGFMGQPQWVGYTRLKDRKLSKWMVLLSVLIGLKR